MPKFLKRGFSACIAACALSILSSPAIATPWTFTQYGTIRSGVDEPGRFFKPYTELNGKTFSISYVLDPELYPNRWQANEPHINARYGAYPGEVEVILAIDNVTRSFVLDPKRYSFGGSELYDFLTAGVRGADQAKQVHTGFTSDGIYVDAVTYVYSRSNVYHIGLNFNQTWEYVVRPGDFPSTGITIGTSAGYTQFFGNFAGLGFKINAVEPAQVPEPNVATTIAIGVLGLLASRRRKRPTNSNVRTIACLPARRQRGGLPLGPWVLPEADGSRVHPGRPWALRPPQYAQGLQRFTA